jgi:ABC-type phosphate/phosphonate transport system permease subunit
MECANVQGREGKEHIKGTGQQSSKSRWAFRTLQLIFILPGFYLYLHHINSFPFFLTFLHHSLFSSSFPRFLFFPFYFFIPLSPFALLSVILISFSSYFLSFLLRFIVSFFCSFLVSVDLSSLTFCLLIFVYFLSFYFNYKYGDIVLYSFDTFTLKNKGSRMKRKSGTPW